MTEQIENKQTMSAGKAMMKYREMNNAEGAGPVGMTPTGKRLGLLAEKVGLAPKKDRSTTTTSSITRDGVKRTVSHTKNNRGHTSKISRSGFNEDGSRWEETTSTSESKAGRGGVGGAKSGAKNAGKSAVGMVGKIISAAEDLTR
jgi:hypothetical protein